MGEPLAAHARFRTRRADEAQWEAARVLSQHELRLRRDAPLDARLNAAGHGPVVLCWMDYGADVEVRAPGLGDYVAVNIPVSGAMEVEHRGTRFVAEWRFRNRDRVADAVEPHPRGLTALEIECGNAPAIL